MLLLILIVLLRYNLYAYTLVYRYNLVSLRSVWNRCRNLFFFFFLGATPAAYGGSQAQDRIGALAAGYNHNNTGFEPHPHPTPQLTAMPDPHGIEPASSWLLVGFVTAEPQWELLQSF